MGPMTAAIYVTLLFFGVIIVGLAIESVKDDRRAKLKKAQKEQQEQLEQARVRWILRQLEDPTTIALHERESIPIDNVEDPYRGSTP